MNSNLSSSGIVQQTNQNQNQPFKKEFKNKNIRKTFIKLKNNSFLEILSSFTPHFMKDYKFYSKNLIF